MLSLGCGRLGRAWAGAPAWAIGHQSSIFRWRLVLITGSTISSFKFIPTFEIFCVKIRTEKKGGSASTHLRIHTRTIQNRIEIYFVPGKQIEIFETLETFDIIGNISGIPLPPNSDKQVVAAKARVDAPM